MRRVVLILVAAVVTAGTAACGGGDVAVLTQLQGASTGTQTAEPVALGDLPVRLLPYDRDAIFDSLKAAYPEPEPEIPDSIQALQNRVIAEQKQWKQAENRWLTLRDSLKTLSQKMAGMNKSSGQYFAMFRDFNDLDDQVSGLEKQSNAAFTEFTTAQNRLNEQAREIRLAKQAWADEAYAPIDSIINAKLENLGLQEYADTTNADGAAFFKDIPEGKWWVYARYERQFDELYWNVPIDVQGGKEPTQVQLTEQNAEVRPKL